MYQCADTERIAFGLGSRAPSSAHCSVNRFTSSAFIGFPCPIIKLGKRWDVTWHLNLCHLAPLVTWHNAHLFQHTHQIVKQIPLYDFVMFIPARNSTEINFEVFIGGRNQYSARHSHGPFHSSCELGDRACPFALRKHDVVRVIDEMFWSGNILKNATASRSWASLYLVGHALFFEE